MMLLVSLAILLWAIPPWVILRWVILRWVILRWCYSVAFYIVCNDKFDWARIISRYQTACCHGLLNSIPTGKRDRNISIGQTWEYDINIIPNMDSHWEIAYITS